MPTYPEQGTKTVRCKCGHINNVPFQTTIYTCPSCNTTTVVSFFGTVIDKHGNYVYQT